MNNPDSSNSRITRSQHAVKENQDAVGGEDVPAPVVPPNSKKRKATKQNKKKTTPDDEPAGNISKKPRKGDETATADDSTYKDPWIGGTGPGAIRMLPDIEHIAYPTMTVAQSLEWSLNRHHRDVPEHSAATSETENASPSSSSPPLSRSSPDTDISVFIDPELKNRTVAEQHPQSLDQIFALSKTLFLPTGNPTSSSTAPPPSAPNKHTLAEHHNTQCKFAKSSQHSIFSLNPHNRIPFSPSTDSAPAMSPNLFPFSTNHSRLSHPPPSRQSSPSCASSSGGAFSFTWPKVL